MPNWLPRSAADFVPLCLAHPIKPSSLFWINEVLLLILLGTFFWAGLGDGILSGFGRWIPTTLALEKVRCLKTPPVARPAEWHALKTPLGLGLSSHTWSLFLPLWFTKQRPSVISTNPPPPAQPQPNPQTQTLRRQELQQQLTVAEQQRQKQLTVAK